MSKQYLLQALPSPELKSCCPPASLTFQVDLIQTDLTPLPTPTAHAFAGGGLWTCPLAPFSAPAVSLPVWPRSCWWAPRPAGLLSSLRKSPEGGGAQVGSTGRDASIQEPPGKWPLTAERFKAQAAASSS